MTIRVGVIGTGIMGADHANTLHRMVSGARGQHWSRTSTWAGRRRVAAELPGVRAVADGFALIADDAVDAVVIASHDSTHAALALAAIAAGKPVLCEKPLAPTVAECRRGGRGRRRRRSATAGCR